MSHIVSPEDLHVQPVQDTNWNLAQLEQEQLELQTIAGGEKVVREVERVGKSVRGT